MIEVHRRSWNWLGAGYWGHWVKYSTAKDRDAALRYVRAIKEYERKKGSKTKLQYRIVSKCQSEAI